MMWRNIFGWTALALTVTATTAPAQSLSARRMAMGGVVLSGGGPGSEGANVAYRAVPRGPDAATGFALPIGLIPVLADPPTFDPDDPDFNAYELANLLYNPPWHWALVEPAAPAGDVVVAVSRNSLAVDLGSVRDIFPDAHSRAGATFNVPLVTVGVKRAFVSLMPVVGHVENDFRMNDALHAALAHGEAFTPDTRYEAYDVARGQVAAGVGLGFAAPVVTSADPRRAGSGLYVGARAKVLRGLAYGDADNLAAFTTGDTLFGSDPIDLGYVGRMREAGPDGGGAGFGLDAGAVVVLGRFEFGVGVNDITTRIDWRVTESLATRDSAGDYSRVTVAEGVRYTSEIPTTVTATAATRLGAVTLAADVVRDPLATTAHAGAELWLGRVALRAGAAWDANELLQGSGGLGVRFGRFGLDAAVASHSRTITRERGLDLGVGVSFYPPRPAEVKP